MVQQPKDTHHWRKHRCQQRQHTSHEAIKQITGAGQTLRGRMMIYDALYGETRVFAVRRDPGCKVCGQPH